MNCPRCKYSQVHLRHKFCRACGAEVHFPIYPHSTRISQVSFDGVEGGGSQEDYASPDSYESIGKYYTKYFGDPEAEESDTLRWKNDDSFPGMKGNKNIILLPESRVATFGDTATRSKMPAETRTIFIISSGYILIEFLTESESKKLS